MRHYIWAGKMIINQKPNIIYSDRIGHKHKSLVIKDKLSNNNFKETPLKRESNDISFKGVSLSNLKKSFSFYTEKNYNIRQNIDFLKRYIGKAPEILERNADKWDEIHKYIQKSADNSQVTIKEKNWTRQLIEACGYPITELPFHIAKSMKKSLGFEKAQNEGTKAASGISKFIKTKFDTLNNADIVNSMIGYMESAEKYKYDTEKIRSSGLMANALKMFDPKSGNYNAVHERALTRVVTGFIPAFFLANDAYNLSRICDDDPKTADKEKKLRFNQETKRVLSNAYLQLITLGALSKWINKSKATFIGVTALSVLITEAFSRLSNGKKIHMIDKAEAIEMNKKEGLLPADYTPDNDKEKADKPVSASKRPGFKGSKVFQGFGLASDMPLAQMTNVTMSGMPVDEKLKSINESKPLISISTIAKWFAGTIALGFALKYAKGIKVGNNVKIKDYFSVVSKKYDKVFNSFTQKEHKISKQEFNKIINKIKNAYDEGVANYFESVIHTYQKTSKVQSVAREFSHVLKEAGLKDFAEKFEHLANSKLNKSFKDIPIYNQAQAFIKNRNAKIITQNLNEMFAQMEKENLTQEVKQLKELILDKKGNVDISKYSDAKALINKIAKRFAFTFENRFKVDNGAENLKLFEEAIDALKTAKPDVAKHYQELINESVNADVLTLGIKNKPVIKEIADFITEPFKFIWGTITLPYKHVAKPFVQAISPQVKLPEWVKEHENVAATISRITKKPMVKLPSMFGHHQGIAKIDYENKDFANYMTTQFNKSFNTATMSSLSNSDLSALAKNTSTAATLWFLMTDNHNMVMQKSNGNDKQQAVTKAKERMVQETSRTFYNVMFINLFNNTFRNLYNSSLFGAQTVNTASTLVGEYINRKAIGMPVTPRTRQQIMDKEYENITSDGIKGKFFRFMSRLTGKKVLSQREQKKTA